MKNKREIEKPNDPWKIGYVAIDCRACGLRFGVQDSFYKTVVLGGDQFWCPGGHQIFHTEARKKKLDEQTANEAKQREEQAAKEAAKPVRLGLWDKIKAVLLHKINIEFFE